MPVMDGFVSSRAIRAYEKKIGVQKPTRIIALTGLGSTSSRQEAFASGVDDFWTKPVPMQQIRALLKEDVAQRVYC